MDLEEIGINAGNWVDSAQDKAYWRALVNAAMDRARDLEVQIPVQIQIFLLKSDNAFVILIILCYAC